MTTIHEPNVSFSWYNFDKKEYDFGPTNGNYRPYVPDIVAARGLYDCYLELGDSSLEACRKVLERMAQGKGEK